MLRFNQVLVPLDGSELAEEALPVAVRLLEPGGTLHLVMVHDTAPQWVGLDAVVSAAALAGDAPAITTSAGYLEQVAAPLRSQALVVATAVREGPVAPTLCATATELKADLIVMTTHGRGGFSRFWLGSVVDRVVRSARTPVLCLKPGAQVEREGTVLVPLDGSTLAEAAIDLAMAAAHRLGAGVELVQVVDPTQPVFIGPPGMPLAVTQEQVVSLKLAAHRYLAAIRQRHANGTPVSGAVLTATNPAHAISDHARSRRAALVVMAAHRAGFIERALLGSVTDKVLRGDAAAVLVLRQDTADPA